MIKKIIPTILICSLVFSNISISYASDLDDTDEVFVEDIVLENTDIVLGEQKLLDLGFSQNEVERMPDSIKEKISLADEVNTKKMIISEDDINTVISEFDPTVDIEEKSYDEMKEDVERKIEDISSQIEYSSIPSKRKSYDSNTKYIDSGEVLLELNSYIYGYDQYGTPYFDVVARIRWATMPKYRGKDYIGITRSDNVAYVPNSFGGLIYYQNAYRLYWASNGKIFSQGYEDGEVWNDNVYNKDSSSTAFAIEHILPIDRMPSSYLFDGQSTELEVFWNYNVFVWYSGTITNNVGVNYVNQYLTHLHQYATVLGLTSPTLTYPKGAAITITATKQYNTNELSILDAYTRKK